MKISRFLILFFLGTALTFIACNSKKDADPTQEESTVSPAGSGVQDPAIAATPATATGNPEPHYKCTKEGCTGTGTAQGKCPICGSDLVHNQAFHTQAQGVAGSSPDNPVQINPTTGTTGTTGTTPTTTPAPPPAQNAKGEYHYTCPNGHPGAGAAGNCSKCGTALVHNQAYHNN